VDFGISVFTGYSVPPAELGPAVEERGFESLFYPEHTHIPVRSLRADGSSPKAYARSLDPFVALAAVAATTSRLKLGTGVCLVPERDPIVTAKEVATLDHISGGRFLFGVGAGWNREELANHGTDFGNRRAVLADRVKAMRAIWTEEEAAYAGTHAAFEPIWAWPKPSAPVPVLVGGNGPDTEDRVLAFGDGWFPQCGPLSTVDELRTRVASLRAKAADQGRDYIPVTVFGVPPDRHLLAAFAEAGVDRCLFLLPDAPADEVMRKLDEYAAIAG
jgi:probable F420-dependent oxidoreductase